MVPVIASILILGIGSMYSAYSVGSPTGPEIEKIMFIDRYMPSDVSLAGDPFPCDQTTGKFKTISGGVHWQAFPVTYSIDTTNFDTSLSSTVSTEAAEAAVKDAFDTWDLENHGGAGVNKNFFSLVTTNAMITVEWQSLDGEGGTLGVTTTHFNPKLKKIVAAEIVFDKGDRWNNFSLECNAQGTGDNRLDFDLEDVTFSFTDVISIRKAFEHYGHGEKISRGIFIVDSDLSYGMARMVTLIFDEIPVDFTIERID